MSSPGYHGLPNALVILTEAMNYQQAETELESAGTCFPGPVFKRIVKIDL